jgi:pimeloyl-ACP methyl ester carboxylesterase
MLPPIAGSTRCAFPRRLRSCVGAVIAAVLICIAAACDDDDPAATTPGGPVATPTARSLPPEVAISPEPQDVALRDPEFEALPGATAEFGRLGGTVYQIEMPDQWNGRLVLYMHGFQGLAPEARVQQPGIRRYLIRNGYAWAASSYSSTALIPGRAADETAALWDYFARRHGRPARTYVTGHSMGGAATHIAAERYADRFDGALGLCGFAGQTAQAEIVTDFFFAGAYAAGVTQAEFDAATDLATLIDQRIRPALDDPARREVFESLLVALTGGPRDFDRVGLRLEEETNWERARILVAARLGTNGDRAYALGAGTDVAARDFDTLVVRAPLDVERMAVFINGNETTGELKMPMITLHTTGDWQVPIDQQQILRRRVDAAGKGDLLVQRVVSDAEHCNFTSAEWEDGLEDLVAWVEGGARPQGEDVLVDDLTQLGRRFTLAPRIGTQAAERVVGSGERITVTGTATLDGNPIEPSDAYLWFEARRDGLRQACDFVNAPLRHGQFERVVAGGEELAGCGGPGAQLVAVAYVFDLDIVVESAPVDWPAPGTRVIFNPALSRSSTAIEDTSISGSVLDASGSRVPPGTIVEAFIGDALCGRTSVPHAVMPFATPDGFNLIVVSSSSVPGCARDAEIRLLVDGAEVEDGTARHTFGGEYRELHLRD